MTTRYYLGQAVVVRGELPSGGLNGWVSGVEFQEGGARYECDVKMDALKEGRHCERGTEGCIAKHTLWRMWGPQLLPTPWGRPARRWLLTFREGFVKGGKPWTHAVVPAPVPPGGEGLVGFGYNDGVGFIDRAAVTDCEALVRDDTPTGRVNDLSRLRAYQVS